MKHRQNHEAEETEVDASTPQASPGQKVLTRSELQKLTIDQQNEFRRNHGTVTEDPV